MYLIIHIFFISSLLALGQMFLESYLPLLGYSMLLLSGLYLMKLVLLLPSILATQLSLRVYVHAQISMYMTTQNQLHVSSVLIMTYTHKNLTTCQQDVFATGL
jgi:hypothetical protein